MIGLALHLIGLFAAVCVVASLLVGAAMHPARARVASLEPDARARLMLAALAAPPFFATLAVTGVALPHQWLGMTDHCIHHPGHLHICFVHGAPMPDALVAVSACIAAAYVLHRLGRSILNALRGALAVRRVLGAARRRGDVWVLPGEAPVAFTVGLARPAVVVSEAVLSRASRWRAVLEHERAHAADRDPFVRWAAEALTAFQVPPLGAALVSQLREAQELRADERAAEAVGCRIEVAETLVEWMRWSHASRDAGVGFDSGPFALRVRRLLDPEPARPGPSTRDLVWAAALLTVTLGLAAPSLHHAVETALGLLH